MCLERELELDLAGRVINNLGKVSVPFVTSHAAFWEVEGGWTFVIFRCQ